MTRRSLESARCSRSTRRGSSGARWASMRSGAWICRSARSSASGERVASALRGVPARGPSSVQPKMPPAATHADADRFAQRGAARRRPAASRPPPGRGPSRSARARRARCPAASDRAGIRPPWRRACSRRRVPTSRPGSRRRKLTIHVPTVTLSVRMAAVEGCSASAAMAAAERDGQPGVEHVAECQRRPAPARRRCRRSSSTAGSALRGGSIATSQPASRTSAFAVMRRKRRTSPAGVRA